MFLDTLPYNAHVTASDALWAGLPVLTCLGESFAGRVAGSLLNALGLAPYLITRTAEEYEERAVEMVQDRAELKHIGELLEQARETSSLFDTLTHTRSLERAYENMLRHTHPRP